jgi:hypothetical protein
MNVKYDARYSSMEIPSSHSQQMRICSFGVERVSILLFDVGVDYITLSEESRHASVTSMQRRWSFQAITLLAAVAPSLQTSSANSEAKRRTPKDAVQNTVGTIAHILEAIHEL